MAIEARNVPDAMIFALVTAWNRRQEAAVASFFHADVTQITSGDYRNLVITNDLVTAADGTDLTTSLVLVNETKAVLNRHFADTLAHDSAVTDPVTTADATDLTTANTLANALKAAYNTGGHINEASVHVNNDGTNTVAAADATDQTTLNTLLNELKDDVNAHIISAPLGEQIKLVDA